MQLMQILISACQLATFAFAAPLDGPESHENTLMRRGKQLDHDLIGPLHENLDPGPFGRNMKALQPYFNTDGPGCWPYPAVDFEGNWSGGLHPSGKIDGDCTNSKGQVYVRGTWANARYLFMYAWYTPKDQLGIGTGGHRHDWEAVAIWVNNPTVARPEILGAAVSRHGGWDHIRGPNGISFSGTHPLVKYYPDTAGFGSHRIGWTGRVGGLQPAVDFDRLPVVVKNALVYTNWGNANFPLAGDNWKHNVERANPWL